MDKSISIRPYTIIGSTESKDAFSRVFLYQPLEEEVLTTRGELFVIFSAAVPGLDIDWEKVAIQSFNHLRDTYYKSDSGGALPALEEALESTREEFGKFISEYIPEGQFPSIDLHLGALVVWGGSYLFRSSGKVFFALFRNNELVDYSQDRFVQEAVQADDSLVLGTAVFGERVGTSVLKKVLESELSDDWQRLIRQEVQDVEENALMSGIILNVMIKNKPGEEEVIEITMPGFEKEKEKEKKKKTSPLSKISRPSIPANLPSPGGFSLARIGRFFSKIKERIGADEIYVRKPEKSGSFKKWLLVVFLVVMLAGSIYYTFQSNQSNEDQEQLQAVENEIRNQLQEVTQIAQSDRQQAKRALDVVEQDIGAVQGVSRDMISEEFSQAYNAVYNVQSPQWRQTPLTVDLAGAAIAVQGDGAILSSGGGDIISVQNGDVIDTGYSEKLNGVQDIVQVENGLYVYHPETGLWFLSTITSEPVKIIDQGGQWGSVSDIATYVDNVYIMAPEVQQLAKYIGIGGGQLSGASQYFVEPVTYETIKDVAIDGFVYLLHGGNRIEKFIGGRRTDFSLSGIYPPDREFKSIETQVDYTHLYIATDGGVIVFDTDGNYVTFLHTEVPVNDLAITQNEDTIYVLTDVGLYSAPLNLSQ